MANNYEQFSFAIDDVTEEEAEWLLGYVVPDSDYSDEDEGPAGVTFAYDIDTVYVYNEGGEGDTEALISMLSSFLFKFRPQDMIGFEIAYTCSKPRTGEFGGTAVAIYGDWTVDSYATTDWLNEKRDAHIKKGQG